MHYRPAAGELRIGPVIDQLFEAWNERNAKKFPRFLQEKAQFWDVCGGQWIGPANIEKGLGPYSPRRAHTEGEHP
jgi:hypothetical protein